LRALELVDRFDVCALELVDRLDLRALELVDRLDLRALELEDRLDLRTTLARDLPLSDRVFLDFAGRNRDFPRVADRLDLCTLARDLPLSDRVFRDFAGLPGIQFYFIHFFCC